MAQKWQNIFVTVSLMVVMAAASIRINDCGEDEILCADLKRNGTCILRTRECDGEIDCPDASDEQMQRCRQTGRPMLALAFHCSNHYTRNIYPVDVCHPLCFRLRDPELCFYAMMTMYAQPVGTCMFPDWPENGKYDVIDAQSYADITLYYTCERGYDLIGTQQLSCVDGVWQQHIPTCKPLSGWAVADEDLRK